MTGHVDNSGPAIVSLLIRPSDDAQGTQLPAWVDTAFTGEVVIPRGMIQRLGARVGRGYGGAR